SHGLAERMRSAEIAVQRAPEIASVKIKNVVFSGARLTQGAHTFGIQAGIEFAFVGVEAGREAHQRGRKQSAQQDERGDGPQVPCDFPERRFPRQHFPDSSSVSGESNTYRGNCTSSGGSTIQRETKNSHPGRLWSEV